jgi:hypothetical protein
VTAAITSPCQSQRWASRRRRRRTAGAVSVLPSACLAGQGEQLGPGQQVTRKHADLAPQLVLGKALQRGFRSQVSLAWQRHLLMQIDSRRLSRAKARG